MFLTSVVFVLGCLIGLVMGWVLANHFSDAQEALINQKLADGFEACAFKVRELEQRLETGLSKKANAPEDTSRADTDKAR